MAPAPDYSPPTPTPFPPAFTYSYLDPHADKPQTLDPSYPQAYPVTTGSPGATTTTAPYDADQTEYTTAIESGRGPHSGASSVASANPVLSQSHGHNHTPKVFAAAGSIVAILITIVLLCCCILLCRKKRKNRQRARAAALARDFNPQMKSVAAHVANPRNNPAYLRAPPPNPTPIPVSPSTTSANSGQQSPPPVLLSTTMDNSYYTGIDTSDHISLVETRSQSSSEEGNDEPPPPYRPRSVPPISRDSSLRYLNGAPINSGSIRRSRDLIRSPFDDPEEEGDGALSPVSPTAHNLPQPPSIRTVQSDQMSIVSDLSYQQDPTTTHSTV